MTVSAISSLSPRRKASHLMGHINELGLIAIILVLYVIFGVVSPGFLSTNNQVNILRDGSTIGIAAWAQTLVIVAGEIDISFGPMVAFVSVATATV